MNVGDMDEQFILRLPLTEAEKIRNILKTKPERLKKYLKIDLDVSKHEGVVYVGKKKLRACLRKFPTIIESYKTNICGDVANLYKTADVCHILECVDGVAEPRKKRLSAGYTAPLKNAKSRFRKTLVNTEVAEDTELIAKELYYLFSTDLEATSSRFEIIYNEDYNRIQNPSNVLFGDVSSESGDDCY
ncbi:transcription initiation factor TFIID subunit 7-like [Cylas formicarius]|uniref:transcription initiation factor TFIID subunit 7-like n=1 Tax=Cylas formicarius TaxID=197179 RepID=UPI0029583ACC|nr:transcription initiation factor TFIID subunit 7-like [Cylas formicarius]